MRANQELDLKNQNLLKGVNQPKITDSDLAGIEDDVDFKDLEDDQEDLKFDYSQVDPYDKNTLKNSQIPAKKHTNNSGAGSMSSAQNPYMTQLRHLEDNDNLTDSLQVEQPRKDETMAERGQRLLQAAGTATRAEVQRQAEQIAAISAQLADSQAHAARLLADNDALKARLAAAAKDLAGKDDQLRRLDEKATAAGLENERLAKDYKAVSEKHEAAKLQLMEARRQLGGVTKEKMGAERENTQMGKTQKKFEGDLAKKEQR